MHACLTCSRRTFYQTRPLVLSSSITSFLLLKLSETHMRLPPLLLLTWLVEKIPTFVSFSYDKLLARFGACHKSAEKSKFEATMNAYKLGYLDCSTGNDPFYAIGDRDIEMLCSDLLHMQKQAVEEVAEEDEAEEDAADEVVTNIADQASGVVENVADQADAKDAIDQGSPASVSG
ncbi:unnamed protein product [Prunus brigantina]